MAVQPGLCGTWSETPKTGFLTTRLILDYRCIIQAREPLHYQSLAIFFDLFKLALSALYALNKKFDILYHKVHFFEDQLPVVKKDKNKCRVLKYSTLELKNK